MEKKHYILLFEKYLRNEASEEETQLLLSLLRLNSDIDLFLEEKIRNNHHELNQDTEMRLYEQISSTIHHKKKSVVWNPKWRKTAQWAAILILPVLSALLVYFLHTDRVDSNNPITITAPFGEKAEVTLMDGSRVWINSGSSLTYNSDYNYKKRELFLKGEAYFEVEKDTKRPFIVKTERMEIQALGTAFNVSAYSNEQEVFSVLLEGKIKVNALGQERILSENERLIIDKTTGTLSTETVYASDFVQWKDGNLYFENRSFEEIANTLSRVYNVDIRFASKELRSIRFSGTLGSSSIRNALDILSLTSAMNYEMKGTVIELNLKD